MVPTPDVRHEVTGRPGVRKAGIDLRQERRPRLVDPRLGGGGEGVRLLQLRLMDSADAQRFFE